MELAAISAIEGHTGAALDWLERGYRAGWKDARLLNLDPFFASVRREPRYQARGHGHDAGRGGDAEAGGGRASLAVRAGVTSRALIARRDQGRNPATP